MPSIEFISDSAGDAGGIEIEEVPSQGDAGSAGGSSGHIEATPAPGGKDSLLNLFGGPVEITIE